MSYIVIRTSFQTIYSINYANTKILYSPKNTNSKLSLVGMQLPEK
jgi:hypothetical protein